MLKSTSLLALAILVSFSVVAGSNSLPNGRPFQQIQSQLDEINATIEELSEYYATRFAEIDSAIGGLNERIDSNQDDVNALQARMDLIDINVSNAVAAIDVLQARADDADMLDEMQQRLIDAINLRLTSVEDSVEFLESDNLLLWSTIHAMQGDINILLPLVDQVSGIGETVTNIQSSVDQMMIMLSRYCPAGQVVTGVSSVYGIECSDAGTSITLWSPVAATSYRSFCAEDLFGLCIDTDYYRLGSVSCPSGYNVIGGGFESPGVSVYRNRPMQGTAWLVQTFVSENLTAEGLVFATCLKR